MKPELLPQGDAAITTQEENALALTSYMRCAAE
jgi:hypothetical protein